MENKNDQKKEMKFTNNFYSLLKNNLNTENKNKKEIIDSFSTNKNENLHDSTGTQQKENDNIIEMSEILPNLNEVNQNDNNSSNQQNDLLNMSFEEDCSQPPSASLEYVFPSSSSSLQQQLFTSIDDDDLIYA